MCHILKYYYPKCRCICSSEKTTSYRRTSGGSQGKGSAPSPGYAGSQEELYCSPASNPAPPPANVNNSVSVPVLLPPPRSRKNAMVIWRAVILIFRRCLLYVYVVCILFVNIALYLYRWNTLENFCSDISEEMILVFRLRINFTEN